MTSINFFFAKAIRRSTGRMNASSKWIGLFWVASIVTTVVMVWSGPAAWDFQVYRNAIQSVRTGGDPYADGIAVQQAFHDLPNKSPHAHPPMTYVYSPMTLPALRFVARFPERTTATVYGVLLLLCFALQLWASWQMANVQERRWLGFVLPAVAFFPGLLNDDVLLSGNVAYILYGFILAAAVPGWKRNRWEWFYLAVILASCCKAPLLTLLALPLLLGRRQWLPAILAGTAGTLLFLMQSVLWPSLFGEYLRAVELQFSWNVDFGVSPSGLLGAALVENGLPYSTASTILYLFFAAAIGLLLFLAARRLDGSPALNEFWLPTAIIGTILLNPRIKEYDVAAITVPMLLLASRLLRILVPPQNFPELESALDPSLPNTPTRVTSRRRQFAAFRRSLPILLAGSGWFLAANFVVDGDTWKPCELVILLILFTGGVSVLFVRGAALVKNAPAAPSLTPASSQQTARAI